MIRTLLLMTAIVLASAATATAQTPDEDGGTSADVARATATQLFTEGVGFLGKKDYAAALDRFQQAYAIYPSPKMLINIGTSLKNLGRPADAANTFQRWLDDPGADSAKRADVQKQLTDLDTKLGSLAISTTPTDAEVQVDGWQIGWQVPAADLSPWLPVAQLARWRVTAGTYTVRARRSGYVAGEQAVTVDVGQKQAAAIALAEEPKVVVPEHHDEVAVVTQPEVIVEEPEHPPAPAPAIRLGALIDVVIDPKLTGAAISPGVAVRFSDRIEVDAKALVSAYKGAYVGAAFYLTRGKIRPQVAAGIPMFFSDGVRLGVRGAAGVSFELGARFSAVGEVGAEYFFNPEMDRLGFAIVPVIGVRGRL